MALLEGRQSGFLNISQPYFAVYTSTRSSSCCNAITALMPIDCDVDPDGNVDPLRWPRDEEHRGQHRMRCCIPVWWPGQGEESRESFGNAGTVRRSSSGPFLSGRSVPALLIGMPVSPSNFMCFLSQARTWMALSLLPLLFLSVQGLPKVQHEPTVERPLVFMHLVRQHLKSRHH